MGLTKLGINFSPPKDAGMATHHPGNGKSDKLPAGISLASAGDRNFARNLQQVSTSNPQEAPASSKIATLPMTRLKMPGVRSYPLDISIARALKAELSLTGDFSRADIEKLKRQVIRVLESLEEAFAD